MLSGTLLALHMASIYMDILLPVAVAGKVKVGSDPRAV